MDLLTYLKQNKFTLVWFALVLTLCFGFNKNMFETNEYRIVGFIFDIIVPFSSGVGMCYQYATWHFNTKKQI